MYTLRWCIDVLEREAPLFNSTILVSEVYYVPRVEVDRFLHDGSWFLTYPELGVFSPTEKHNILSAELLNYHNYMICWTFIMSDGIAGILNPDTTAFV